MNIREFVVMTLVAAAAVLCVLVLSQCIMHLDDNGTKIRMQACEVGKNCPVGR